MTHHCPACNTDKPTDAFYKRSEIGRGLSKLCIVCTNAKSKQERKPIPKSRDNWIEWQMLGITETDY